MSDKCRTNDFNPMASIKFLVRGKVHISPIMVRVLSGRKIDVQAETGYLVKPDDWNAKKGEPALKASFHDKRNLNDDLTILRAKIELALSASLTKGDEVNVDWLKKVIDKHHGRYSESGDIYLVDHIHNYIKYIETKLYSDGREGAKAGTIRTYKTLLHRLGEYEKATGVKVKLLDVNLHFHKVYSFFLKTQMSLGVNSIGKDLRQIKTVCFHAKDNGEAISPQVETKKFYAPTRRKMIVTLTEAELSHLMDFKGPDYLINARDWLIIGSYTACRVGDLMRLTMDNVMIYPDGRKFIKYIQSKTGKMVHVPLHPFVNAILERLGGFPRSISEPKFNQYIKEVCSRAGLVEMVKGSRQNPQTHILEEGIFPKWMLVTSHICRRSFATNHYSKLSNKLIMAVTGHSTERQLLSYIGMVDNAHIDDFEAIWSKEVEQNRIVENGN